MDNFLEYELKTHLGAILDSKIPKKESKSNQNWKRGSASKRANQHSLSANWHLGSVDADWHKVKAQPGNLLIKIKPVFF